MGNFSHGGTASQTGKLALAEIPLCSSQQNEATSSLCTVCLFSNWKVMFFRSHGHAMRIACAKNKKSIWAFHRQQESLGCSVGLTLWKLCSYFVIRSAVDCTAVCGAVWEWQRPNSQDSQESRAPVPGDCNGARRQGVIWIRSVSKISYCTMSELWLLRRPKSLMKRK